MVASVFSVALLWSGAGAALFVLSTLIPGSDASVGWAIWGILIMLATAPVAGYKAVRASPEKTVRGRRVRVAAAAVAASYVTIAALDLLAISFTGPSDRGPFVAWLLLLPVAVGIGAAGVAAGAGRPPEETDENERRG